MTSRSYEGRLLKKIARQAVECGKEVWIKDVAKCMGDFEWQSVGGDAIGEEEEGEDNVDGVERGNSTISDSLEVAFGRWQGVDREEIIS